MTHYWSKLIQGFLRTVIFMFLLVLATVADGHLGLPSHINLKQLHLQINLIEHDYSAFHGILAFRQNRACKQEVGHCDQILL